MPQQARAFAPKARSHDPITTPTAVGQSYCCNISRYRGAYEFLLPARPQCYRISRAMRFAKVKGAAASRRTRSKTHCPAGSAITAMCSATQRVPHNNLDCTRDSKGALQSDFAPREKIRFYSSQHKNRIYPMEAERINAIDNQLSSLTARTLELRGYL